MDVPRIHRAVGDGKADDTAAIQALIDNAAAQGLQVVEIPRGTFVVSASGLRLPRGLRLVGRPC